MVLATPDGRRACGKICMQGMLRAWIEVGLRGTGRWDESEYRRSDAGVTRVCYGRLVAAVAAVARLTRATGNTTAGLTARARNTGRAIAFTVSARGRTGVVRGAERVRIGDHVRKTAVPARIA